VDRRELIEALYEFIRQPDSWVVVADLEELSKTLDQDLLDASKSIAEFYEGREQGAAQITQILDDLVPLSKSMQAMWSDIKAAFREIGGQIPTAPPASVPGAASSGAGGLHQA
ncbi:MAG: hypothetical protein R3C68_19905, partial [Myxococcota bacterium]